jgi:hypothetical protein
MKYGTLILLALACVNASADDDWPKVKEDCGQISHPPPASSALKQFESCAVDFFTARPVHLTVKSIVPGSGFGLGPTFNEDYNSGRWQNHLNITGVSSLRRYWLAEGKFTATHTRFGANNSARDRFRVNLYADARDLPLMPFYGIGPNVGQNNLVNFRERDVRAGADVINPFSAWFAAGGTVESIFPQIGGVTTVDKAGTRSIEQVFTEATAPGLASQPTFMHYQVFAEPRHNRGPFEFSYRAGFHVYQDTSGGHYSFRQFTVDGTHTFHPEKRDDSFLTIHNRLTISDVPDGNVIPFYLQQTLGGSDIDGQATLRGFRDYRFRAPDNFLIQVQYDRRIWGPLGLVGFYDTGQVANRAGDLSFADMRHSFGFGVSIWTGNRAVFRATVGLGSGEGRHTYFGIPTF